jgi:hypothetical protein
VAPFIEIETGETRSRLENQPRNTARSSTETRREGNVSRAYDVAQIEISRPATRLALQHDTWPATLTVLAELLIIAVTTLPNIAGLQRLGPRNYLRAIGQVNELE